MHAGGGRLPERGGLLHSDAVSLDTRRVASTLLGFWLAGSLFMAWVATHNFRGVEQVLAAPPPPVSGLLAQHGRETLRLLLRYQVAELNRFYFARWELAQIGLGLALTVVLLRLRPRLPWLAWSCILLTALTVAEHWLINPEVVRLGRIIDFVTTPAPERERFWALHAVYSSVEVFRLALLAAMTIRLWIASPRDDGGRPALS